MAEDCKVNWGLPELQIVLLLPVVKSMSLTKIPGAA